MVARHPGSGRPLGRVPPRVLAGAAPLAPIGLRSDTVSPPTTRTTPAAMPSPAVPPPPGPAHAASAPAPAVAWRGIRDPRAARLVAAYEDLRRDNLGALLALYSEDARFKDPFNVLRGRAAIGQLFSHMFATLAEARFVVIKTVCEGDEVFLVWDFHCRRHGARARPMRIHGSSHLRFDREGRVQYHRDYWDPAEELYAHLPLLGPLLRWLQRRLQAPG